MLKRLLFIIILTTTLAGCHHDDPVTPADKQYGRTVLVYMAMQNSLGSSGFHRSDSIEIANAMAYIPKNDRMLLFIDDARKPRLYELNAELTKVDKKTGRPQGPKLVKEWMQDVSSVDPATLNEVLRFMREKYPSESYGLVMGSHADGWLPNEKTPTGKNMPRKSFGVDVGPDGQMEIDLGVAGSIPDVMEIKDLAQSIEKSGVHLDYVLFDACLMQCVEVDYALRRATDYVIASPISIAAEGAYYTDLVQYGLFSGDPVDVARTYVSYYQGNGTKPKVDFGTVLSCVRTSELDNLATVVSETLNDVLCRKAGKLQLSAEEKMEMLKEYSLDDTFFYYAYSKSYRYRPHFYDLKSAMHNLCDDATVLRRLDATLTNAIVYYDATETFWVGPSRFDFRCIPEDRSSWCGVSMFIPRTIYDYNATSCSYGALNEAYRTTEWWRQVY